MDAKDSEKQVSAQLPHWARWTAFVVTIISLAIAGTSFVWGLRAEKRKRLDFAYLAKLSLVSPEVAGQVRVTFGDRDIRNLTKLSARITNSGDIPIEKRDIEQAPTITFGPGISVLEAKVTELSPNDIAVAEPLTAEPNQVVISHGLLNPGDSITFEVLLDGILREWPEPTMRISGVRASGARVPTDKLVSYRVAFFPMPRILEYLALALGSVAGIVMIIISFFALVSAFEQFSLPSNLNGLLDDGFDQSSILRRLRIGGGSDVASRHFVRAFNRPKWEWLDDKAAISSSLNTGEGVSVDRLYFLLREKLPQAVARSLYYRLPYRLDRIAERAVMSVRFSPQSDQSTSDFLRSARRAVENALRSRSFWERVDTGDLAGSVILLLIGVMISLVMSGAWRMVLAM